MRDPTSRERYLASSRSCKLQGMTREAMIREQPQRQAPRRRGAPFLLPAGVLLATWLSPAAAQDIRGMEVCTAETKMERRTGRLQATVEFLQQPQKKHAPKPQDKIPAAGPDPAAARAEIAALRTTVE